MPPTMASTTLAKSKLSAVVHGPAGNDGRPSATHSSTPIPAAANTATVNSSAMFTPSAVRKRGGSRSRRWRRRMAEFYCMTGRWGAASDTVKPSCVHDVMCDPRGVMDAARQELARVRDSAAWPELGFEAAVGADGYAYDRNAVLRAKVLWALQYDHGPDDLPLVRWIAEQEARCRHEAPFQGMSEETELAGFLLASLGRIEDVWLHWQIKRANFDTWCGYDMQYMLGAGVTATVDFVRASDHADRDAVLERLLDADGEPHVDDDEL